MSMLKSRFLLPATLTLLSLSGACSASSEPGASPADTRADDGGERGGTKPKPANLDGGLGDASEPAEGDSADGGAQPGRGTTGGRDAGEGPRGGAGGNGDAAGSDAAAAGSGGSGGSDAATAGGGAPPVTPSVDPTASAELFDQSTVVRFDITLPQASIDALGAASDVYTHAGLTYRDTTLADVGIRIKGESSRRTLMQKAAFKIKIDEYVAGQTLLGMKRITLNNMLSDDTYMSECLAYYVWRAARLPAPRCNHAVVYVNDTYYGVYAHVESEDKAFLSRWFASNDGNLYEDGMADFVTGAESSFELKTNEMAEDRSDLTALISAIQNASSETYLQDLDAVLDTTHFLRYAAMEAAVNQWDGYSFTYFEPNNYHFYNDPTTGKFTFIPWGHDLSMKAFRYTGDDRPARQYIPLFERPLYENRTGGRDSGGRIFVGDRVGQRAQGGCLDSAECRTRFAEAVREVIAVYDGANVRALAEQTYALIRPHIYEQTSRIEVSNDRFEAAYQTLLTFIDGRTQAMRDDLTAAGFTP
jgi:hypothetical protein